MGNHKFGMRDMLRPFSFFLVASLFTVIWSSANAADKGTMHLVPDDQWAKAIPDSQLKKMRGGFNGLAFSAYMTAFVENANGDLSGSVSETPTPQITTNTQNGQVSISTAVGFTGNLSGVFNVVQVPGSYNVVNSTLTVNIAIINVTNSAQIPSLSSIFGPTQ
jgi:hypothetical protein